VALVGQKSKSSLGHLVPLDMGQQDALQDDMQGFLKSLRDRLIFQEAAAAAAAAAAGYDDDEEDGSVDEDDYIDK
jgi:hypothetical protein